MGDDDTAKEHLTAALVLGANPTTCFEWLLAPNQWKMAGGIKVENTSNKMRRVFVTVKDIQIWESET